MREWLVAEQLWLCKWTLWPVCKLPLNSASPEFCVISRRYSPFYPTLPDSTSLDTCSLIVRYYQPEVKIMMAALLPPLWLLSPKFLLQTQKHQPRFWGHQIAVIADQEMYCKTLSQDLSPSRITSPDLFPAKPIAPFLELSCWLIIRSNRRARVSWWIQTTPYLLAAVPLLIVGNLAFNPCLPPTMLGLGNPMNTVLCTLISFKIFLIDLEVQVQLYYMDIVSSGEVRAVSVPITWVVNIVPNR